MKLRLPDLLSFALVLQFFNPSAFAQSNSNEDLKSLCEKAGFIIESKSIHFNQYLYQKAFLNFDRIDSFRLENAPAVYTLENGEAFIRLESASVMRESHGKKIEVMEREQPRLRFVLNVNGQVKEQPVN